MQTIEPEETYSLSYLVQNGMFGNVKSFSTARSHAMSDLLSDNPILKAEIKGEGHRRTITVRGSNLIAYLERKLTSV